MNSTHYTYNYLYNFNLLAMDPKIDNNVKGRSKKMILFQ